MVPRGKLDIPFSTLFSGIGYCISDILGLKRINIANQNNILPCLSVRTGFDLTLRTLNFKPGSEILVTDINIPDMFSIIAAHQLVAVPLSLNKHTLGISIKQVESAITSSTKAILITHLFGAIMDTDALVHLARKHNLTIIEDCAQAFNGSFKPNPQADVLMYSFGLIKTNTTLTGAILQVNNQELYGKIQVLNNKLPEQPTILYLKKLFKAIIVNLITYRTPYTLLYKLSRLVRKDFDQVLSGFTRGFPGADVTKKIGYRPSYPNLRVIQKRIAYFSEDRISKRKELALQILKGINSNANIGGLNSHHTYWVIPIEVKNPVKLIESLRAHGFDATSKASSLIKLQVSENTIPDTLLLDQLVYLPSYPDISQDERTKLNNLLLEEN